MIHDVSIVTAVSCAFLSSTLLVHAADDSQVGPCDIMELVMVIDSSGSVDPSKELCRAIYVASEALDPEFVRTVVVAEDEKNNVPCSNGFVDDLYPILPDMVPGTSIDSSEDWGDAISVVCSGHQWRSAPRILVVFSDECAEGGNNFDGRPCEEVDELNLPQCGEEDDLAIDRALLSALNHDVRVITVATLGPDGKRACDEVIDGMHRLAYGSGGILIDQSLLQDQSPEGLGLVIRDRVASLMPQHWSQCCEDLDRDGQIGATDLAELLSSWSTSNVRADFDQSGVVDAGDLARLLGSWGVSCGD